MANIGMTQSAVQQPLVGIFTDKNSAERAYDALVDMGYSREETSVLMTEETRKRHFSTDDSSELGSKAMEGAGVGGAIGSVIGGLVGALAAIGTSIALPGLGLIVAGPLAAALAGAGAGGLTGGLLGALIGSGIPEEQARNYENQLRNGAIMIAATPRNANDAQRIEASWRQFGGVIGR